MSPVMATAPLTGGPATTAAVITRARWAHTAAIPHVPTLATPALLRSSHGMARPRIMPAAGTCRLPQPATTSTILAAIWAAVFLPSAAAHIIIPADLQRVAALAAARITTPVAAQGQGVLAGARMAGIIQGGLRPAAHHLATAAAVIMAEATEACTDAAESWTKLRLQPSSRRSAPYRRLQSLTKTFQQLEQLWYLAPVEPAARHPG